ncbi:MAG: alanine--tRNA ligase [Chromatiales bacterium]|nr:alanine--tRNA ligase [Chromatiales bacterium]
MKSSAALRQAFLTFFQERGHTVVPSSSLVPGNDPTLLFTNAGMVQFKDTFLGQETREYSRAASSQRCVRAGGKHNDLENVGYTARHHTFFEMLGNFSFGDYFKRDAIRYAWEFLTGVMGLPAERLWVTVFNEDHEAADIWLKEVGVDPDRFSRIGAKDNFWSMGDTGPCGPCTEIFYDHGPEIPGGPPGTPDEDGDRYVEIWNLVFMQYDRDIEGNLHPLPKPSVDTGMGLERLAAVMQGVHSNYQIDLFRALIDAAARLAGRPADDNSSLRVIADHIRSCAFLIVDGVLPANDGRGYVLRRIIRRAIRHGYKLGIEEPFFYKLVGALCEQMGGAYPELVEARSRVEQALETEEKRFAETLEQGMTILEQDLAGLAGSEIPGETVFKLYDTYGFPVDLTADIARERDLTVDMAGFEAAMERQRERARSASHFGVNYGDRIRVDGTTEFLGYDHLDADGRVIALYRDGKPVERLVDGETGLVVLDRTPFYAESGGQVGDHGVLALGDNQFLVQDTQKQGVGIFVHNGMVRQGGLSVGDTVAAHVDTQRRSATVLNHSATHLLHAALRTVLGSHVAQKGSLVGPERLRFDFSHPGPVSRDELIEIERLVNEQVRFNNTAETRVMALDEAMKSGAVALFGEKYGDNVRVLRLGDFSVELCGGTHVKASGDIGLFKIVSESGVASGVRRIEAVTGQSAIDLVESNDRLLDRIADLIKGSREGLDSKVVQMLDRMRRLEKELDQLQGRLASAAGDELEAKAQEISGIHVLAARLDGADAKTLRETLDQLKNKLGTAAVVLASVEGEKVKLVAGVTADATKRIRAGDLVNVVAEKVGGRGGGRPDMAQAGGNNPQALDGALAGVPDWVKSHLS